MKTEQAGFHDKGNNFVHDHGKLYAWDVTSWLHFDL